MIQIDKYQALSQLFLASGKMQASIGLEPQIDNFNHMELEAVTNIVKNTYDEWNAGKLPALTEVRDVQMLPYNPKATDDKI